MRFFITGLNGLIGWNLFETVRQFYPVQGTFREWHPRLVSLPVLQLNWEDDHQLERLFSRFDPDILIHSWAMCDLDLCEEIPEMAEKINVTATVKILAAAKKIKSLKRFIYISTDHVFSGEEGNYTEDHVPNPKHVYGRTKFEAEKLVQTSGLSYLIVRPGLAIGESLQGRKGPKDFLLTRIRAKKPTHYFTDEWRTPVRAHELAQKVMQLSVSNITGIVHIAGEQIYNRYELARFIAEENKETAEHIFPRLRAQDRWAAIRPKNLSLKSLRIPSSPFQSQIAIK